jgi:hypothetical protein
MITFIATMPLVYKYTLDVHIHALGGGEEFAVGDMGPGQNNKWHNRAISLTQSRMVVVAQSGRSPARGGGKFAAARSLRLGFRRGSRRWRSMCGHGSYTGGLGKRLGGLVSGGS